MEAACSLYKKLCVEVSLHQISDVSLIEARVMTQPIKR